MDFDFTDDQHEIKRTARDLLTERSTCERVREAAEGGAHRRRAVARARRARLARASRSPRSTAARASASSSSRSCSRSSATRARRRRSCGSALAGAGDPAGRLDRRSSARWLPGLASGELRGRARRAPALMPGRRRRRRARARRRATGCALVAGADADVEPVDAIDPTRRHARVGDAAPASRSRATSTPRRTARAWRSPPSSSASAQRALEMTRRLRQGPQAVRHAGRRLPGRLAPLRADAAATPRWRASATLLRGVGGRRRRRTGSPRPRRWPKAAASDAGREVTASAIQVHGGIGFTWEADVHWLYKRAQLDAALLGGAGAHRARLARLAAARLAGARA